MTKKKEVTREELQAEIEKAEAGKDPDQESDSQADPRRADQPPLYPSGHAGVVPRPSGVTVQRSGHGSVENRVQAK